ncbi:hypothetical protein [Endozoicomonas acroporae]|uniref:hypothetical protein n=1 Tax=Endozoicomonas acroporae TaxID=1701104 RepID=UPI003D7BC5D8
MEVFHPLTIPASNHCPAIEMLQHRLSLLRQSRHELHWKDYENELHNLMALAEQEILSEDLQKLDVNEPFVSKKSIKQLRENLHFSIFCGNCCRLFLA